MCMNLEKIHHAGHVLVTFWTSWIVSMSQWPRWRTTSWEFLGCFCCRCVGQKKLDACGGVIDMICWGDTVDGRNPANQLISSLSHYIFTRSFLHPRWLQDFWTINRMIGLLLRDERLFSSLVVACGKCVLYIYIHIFPIGCPVGGVGGAEFFFGITPPSFSAKKESRSSFLSGILGVQKLVPKNPGKFHWICAGLY